MAEEKEILKALAVLGAAYPNFSLGDETVGVYCQMLKDVPAELLEAAVKEHVSKARFFPTIAEIREAAANLTNQGSDFVSAPEAWSIVLREMRRVGYVGSPSFGSELVAKAVEFVGGWQYLCGSENGVADRARFLQAYETLQRRQKMDAMTLPQLRAGKFKLLDGGKE